MIINGREFEETLKPIKNEDGSFSFVGEEKKHIYTIRVKEKNIIIESEEIEKQNESIFDLFN
jgi:hypothetical protein